MLISSTCMVKVQNPKFQCWGAGTFCSPALGSASPNKNSLALALSKKAWFLAPWFPAPYDYFYLFRLPINFFPYKF